MSEQLLESVKAKYGAVAASALSNDHAGVQAVAEAFGYSAEELTSIPADAFPAVIPQQPHVCEPAKSSSIWAPAEALMCSWRRKWWGQPAAPSAST